MFRFYWIIKHSKSPQISHNLFYAIKCLSKFDKRMQLNSIRTANETIFCSKIKRQAPQVNELWKLIVEIYATGLFMLININHIFSNQPSAKPILLSQRVNLRCNYCPMFHSIGRLVFWKRIKNNLSQLVIHLSSNNIVWIQNEFFF